jgi:putative oxidoreductase
MNTRILTYLLALIFFVSGGAKLLSLPFEVEAFSRWGYSSAFMYFTGMLEIFGAMGLLLTRLSAFSSLCLGVLMLGAVGTHVVYKEWLMLIVASSIALALFWRAWFARGEIYQLFQNFGLHK